MIRFYFHPTPNPAKVALLLEETGLPYEMVPVDASKGEQHTPAFRAINPNGKVPAIVDTEGPGGKEARVFDSSACDKTGTFIGQCYQFCGTRHADMRWTLQVVSQADYDKWLRDTKSAQPAPGAPR